jgi:thymidylate synthase (FAD)
VNQEHLKEIKVLDKGFVRLVDYMGDDARIVQAARVSYGAGTKTARSDAGLIHYLYRNGHTSPLEQVQFTFHEKMPVFVARQVVRHRTAKLNEISGRYSVMRDEFYVPGVDRMQRQAEDNKQGSSSELIQLPEAALNTMEAEQRAAYAQYEKYLEMGMSRELARINLPLTLYTEWYWTIDLHNLLHFLRLRLDAHAQWEVRQYAQAKFDLIQPIVPMALAAFDDCVLRGKKFTGREWDFLVEGLNEMFPSTDWAGHLVAKAKDQLKGGPATEFIKKVKG